MPTDPQKPVAPEVVADLHAQGKGRNEIARALHTTTYRVDKAAREAGVIFDGTMTEAAIKARREQANTERAALTARLRDVPHAGLHIALNDHSPPSERKQGVIMAAIAIDKEASLSERVDFTEALEQADLFTHPPPTTLFPKQA